VAGARVRAESSDSRKEVDAPRLHVVAGSDDLQLAGVEILAQDPGPRSELGTHVVDVEGYGLTHRQRAGAVITVATSTERSRNWIDDRRDMTAIAARPFSGVEVGHRGRHRATVSVTQYDNEAHVELVDREFQAPERGRRGNVTGHPDHEDVSYTLIQHGLDRHTRIRASQDRSGRFLLKREGMTRPQATLLGATIQEAAIPLLKSGEQVVRCRR
jgi:hypothetical protein